MAEYLTSAIPQGESERSITISSINGYHDMSSLDSLANSVLTDSGEVTEGNNFVFDNNGNLRNKMPDTMIGASLGTNAIVTVQKVGDRICMVYTTSTDTVLRVYYPDGSSFLYKEATLKAGTVDGTNRSFVQFNVYNAPTSPTSTFTKKIVIFPDKLSFDYDVEDTTITLASIGGSGIPDIDYATVYLARVFGAKNGRVYASAFNSYVDWDLPTADEEYSEQAAWFTETQSNTKAQNEITAITVYDGHPIIFKKDYMQQIHNTKNPFRIVDVGEFGCLNNKAHCECSGILYFVGEDGVYAYNGSYPKRISDGLGITDWTGSVCASGDTLVYVFVPSKHAVYIYNAACGKWSYYSMANNGDAIVAMDTYGNEVVAGIVVNGAYGLYYLNNNKDGAYDETYVEISNLALGTFSNKRAKRMSIMYTMFANGDQHQIRAWLYQGNNARYSTERTKTGSGVMRFYLLKTAEDIIKIKITATGRFTIHGIQIEYATGGDEYK